MTTRVLDRTASWLADERYRLPTRESRPRVAICVPDSFDADDALHAGELSVALDLAEILASDRRPTLISGAPALRALGAHPFDDAAFDDVSFALVVLDRELALDTAGRVPTRLVGTDPLAHDARKRRLAFFDARAFFLGFTRVESVELDSRIRGRSCTLVLDPFVPSDLATKLVEVVRRHAPSLRVLGTPTSAVVRDGVAERYAGPESLDEDTVVFVTNPLLHGLHAGRHETFLLDGAGAPHVFAGTGLPEEDHLLYLGQQWNPPRLEDRLALPARARMRSVATLVKQPLISVVVPVYDRAAELLRLGDSLLAQTYRNLELVFVTNGSPPVTLEALRLVRAKAAAHRIAYRQIDFAEAFGCATVPRDVGSYAASGEFVCYVDSDDYVSPGFFDFAVEKPLRRDTIYYPRRMFRNLGRKMPVDTPMDVVISYKYPRLEAELFSVLAERGNFLNNSGTMISREWFERAGGIAHDFRYCEDYYLWLRLAHMGACAEEHPGVVNIVFHPGNNELVVGDPKWIALAKSRAVQPRTP